MCWWALVLLAGALGPCPVLAQSGVITEATGAGGSVPVNQTTEFTVRLHDALGVEIPWADLAPHHARKLHVYVLHEVCPIAH
jgi:fermentation-respiration switch protein FrsA (DUF1100 family)